jgi:circadian clock protein KaiC
MWLPAGNALRYRRQILALKHYFTGKRSTVLMLDDRTSTENDMQVHSLAHGVVHLSRSSPSTVSSAGACAS